jgi:hypothetical protein
MLVLDTSIGQTESPCGIDLRRKNAHIGRIRFSLCLAASAQRRPFKDIAEYG